MNLKIEVANPKADHQAIYELINEAYKVEDGSEGVAFKNQPRLLHPEDCGLGESLRAGTVIKATMEGKIVGCVVWEIKPASQVTDGKVIYFGPMAVDPACQN